MINPPGAPKAGRKFRTADFVTFFGNENSICILTWIVFLDKFRVKCENFRQIESEIVKSEIRGYRGIQRVIYFDRVTLRSPRVG